MSRLRVKVCGITRSADAELACALGADAVGFIFYPHSPRYVAPEQAARIAGHLPAGVARVGVFVDPTSADISAALQHLALDALQLHGKNHPEAVAVLGDLPKICAFNVGPDFDASHLAQYRQLAAAVLLDGFREGRFGGTGRTIDWRQARTAAKYGRIVLAGGLTPDNVARAVRTAQPYAVDVNSGVEVRPGEKDHRLLKAFFNAIEEFRHHVDRENCRRFPLA